MFNTEGKLQQLTISFEPLAILSYDRMRAIKKNAEKMKNNEVRTGIKFANFLASR